MKINEIFYSLQGEGFWTGTPIVFIRFAGCNLQCDFCDTQHDAFTEMTEDEVLSAIQAFSIHRVCLTGGEPALQVTQSFVNLLHRNDYLVHIETNGTQTLPDGIDWITLSPKTNKTALTYADELKIVYTEGLNLEKWHSFHAAHFFLQPCSNRNADETVNYILLHPKWRLSLQTHKLTGIR